MADAEVKEETWPKVICSFLGFYWRGVFMVIWPFVSALVFILGSEEKFRCLFVVCLMAGYWVTEVVHLGVTGLLPIVLMPLLGVQDTASICLNYFNKSNVIFMGSILIATGIEHCGLHRRIAYRTLLIMGCGPRRLHLGLAVVTSLLSMWLINAATAAMMCPIIQAILEELEQQGISKVYKDKLPTDHEGDPPRPANLTIALYLTTAFASTIGGIGTLVGTGTNLTYKGLFETRFPEGDKIDFVPWALFNIPPMLLMTIFLWISIEFVFMGLWRPNSPESLAITESNKNVDKVEKVVKDKMAELGPFTWNEIGVLLLFIICIIAWLFRKPQFIPGWGDLYKTAIADATPAIAVVFMFAAIPSSWAFFSYCTKDKSKRPLKPSQSLVPWKVLQEKFPWGLLFLLGGGFALADAGKKSGMSQYLGEKLAVMKSLPPFLVLCIISFAAEWVTELTSNVATCNILIPITIEMSLAMSTHPVKLTFPASIMCSFAFLLPVGTPANAIVADWVNIRTADMVKGGILLKIFAWIIYIFLWPSYGLLFYSLEEFPSWTNDTTTKTTFML